MKFSQTFKVRIYECKPDSSLKLASLLDYMQETAAWHTLELKISLNDLFPLGLTWMLSRYHIVIDRYPHYGDTITMQTWVSKHSGMFSIREHQVFDEAGQSLVRATSSWMLYKIDRKMTVPLREAPSLDCVLAQRALEDNFSSLPVPDSYDSRASILVRLQDLDINRHVNNRNIAEWALESPGLDFLQENILKSMEISFKGQAFYGNSIHSDCKIGGEKKRPLLLHHLTCAETQRSIALLRTRWKTREP